MNKENRIKITLTECQWEIVYSRVRGKSGKTDKQSLQSHITSELQKISSLCNSLPDSDPCLECKQQISIGLPTASFNTLEYIAQKTGVNDPGLIVSKFIINPLLLKD